MLPFGWQPQRMKTGEFTLSRTADAMDKRHPASDKEQVGKTCRGIGAKNMPLALDRLDSLGE